MMKLRQNDMNIGVPGVNCVKNWLKVWLLSGYTYSGSKFGTTFLNTY